MTIHRLIQTFESASPEQVKAGRTWYPKARVRAKRMARKHGYTPTVTAGVIAVLSPNCRWERNIKDAETVLDAVNRGIRPSRTVVTAYNRNKAKAFKVARGRVELISGPKVTAFWHALSGDDDSIVIDSHAINAYLGQKASGKKTPSLPLVREVTSAYLTAAACVGESPCTFQAAVWIMERGIGRGGSK